MNPFGFDDDDAFLMDILSLRYKWNSVQNMHLIIFFVCIFSVFFFRALTPSLDEIVIAFFRQEKRHKKYCDVAKYLWWWSDELWIDSDRPTDFFSSRQWSDEKKKPRWKTFLWPKKRIGMLPWKWKKKTHDKKKYLKLLPKNEFRKPTQKCHAANSFNRFFSDFLLSSFLLRRVVL